MNSSSIGINAPWWFFAITLCLCFGASLWYYSRTLPPILPGKKAFFTLIRTIALSALIIALFEPVVSIFRSITNTPGIHILVDNSLSVSLQDASKNRREQVKSTYTSLTNLFTDNTFFSLFDDTILDIVPEGTTADSLRLNGNRTDIERSLRYAYDHSEEHNTQAIVLVSDGVFTAGNNPLSTADIVAKPIFVVGIGDSSEPKDLRIESVILNDVGYINTEIPISITLRSSGIGGKNVRLRVTDNGSNIGDQTITLRDGIQQYTPVFSFIPTTPGVHRIFASVESVEGEITTKNNSLSGYTTIRSNKRKIALFAGTPSPDVAFIRELLENDKSIEVLPYIQRQGAEYYEPTPSEQTLRDVSMVITVGFPIVTTPASVVTLVASTLRRGVPILFIASQQLDYSRLRPLEEFLPFQVQTSRSNEFLVTANILDEQKSNPLLRLPGVQQQSSETIWNQLPPLYHTETFVRTKPESEVLSSMRVNNVVLNDPLIVSRSLNNNKSIAILGYGLYRWKLLGNAQDQANGNSSMPDVLSSLLDNSGKWLTTNDQEKKVKVKTTKREYNNGEQVELVGFVTDATNQPTDNAKLVVTVQGQTTSLKREIILSSVGMGKYSAYVDGLAVGDYSFVAKAIDNSDKIIGTDDGRFSIGDVQIEYSSITMNIGLLRALAQRTGGGFYTPETMSKLKEDIEKHPQFKPRVTTQTNEFALWNLAWLLTIALSAFAIEWVLRKRAGMI